MFLFFLYPTAFSILHCLFLAGVILRTVKNFKLRCRGNSQCSIKAIIAELYVDIRFIYLIKEYHTHSISNYQ